MKKFNDIFSLGLSSESIKKYDNLYINKITKKEDNSTLSVFFYAQNYYKNEELNFLIKKINEKYFRKKRIIINYKIKYNIENFDLLLFLDNNKEDIKLELKKQNIVLCNMYIDSKIEVLKNDSKYNIVFTIPNFLLYIQKENEFINCIKDYFSYTFNIEVELIINFELKEEKNIDELKLIENHNKEYENLHKNDINAHVNPESVAIKKNYDKKINRQKRKYYNDGKVIFGKEIDPKLQIYTLDQLDVEIKKVVIRATITAFNLRFSKMGRRIISLTLSDLNDSIYMTIFPDEEEYNIVSKRLCVGKAIKVEAQATMSEFDKEITLQYIVNIEECDNDLIFPKKKDEEKEKRVELHLHTKMSQQDGVGDIEEYIDKAISYGMHALAITDHGVVHSFAKARHHLQKRIKENKNLKFKLIYGVEGYLVDDTIIPNTINKSNYLEEEYVVFDIETTGLNKIEDKIIEIGACLCKNGNIISTFSKFVNPKIHIPSRITTLTSISDKDVLDAKTIDFVLKDFKDFVGERTLIGHNVKFDIGFIKEKGKKLNIYFDNKTIDTMELQRVLLPNLKNSKLDTLSKALNITNEHHHRAIDDAICTQKCYMKLMEIDNPKPDEYEKIKISYIKKLPRYHIIILAKNDIGRVNLYKIISLSHIKYFKTKPRIPKSLLNEFKEGLIIGSACSEGEIYKSILEGEDEKKLEEIASYYDYLEVQPINNNKYLISEDNYIKSIDDLIQINKKIIDLATKLNKPCVATSDAHFVNEEDQIYRDILMRAMYLDKNKKDDLIKNETDSVKLFLKNTKEMLDSFSYLPIEKAKEIVIKNTNLICSMVEDISPVRDDKCPPILENSDQILKNSCLQNLKLQYGDTIPPLIEERLNTELRSIIDNGYSVMYIAAKKLIDESIKNGYSVGSRGSVGSSFVATMAGISEVNPLPPHYYCKKCHFIDFDSDIVKEYKNETGFDLPNKKCPMCNEELSKDGCNIPFETFLGFNGNKEPDIDLNFSYEYQSLAHKHTNELFGEKNTYKAGTISTLAEKQAYGMIKGYLDDNKISKKKSQIDYMTKRLSGIKKTTGQHPGGIIVLPNDEEIYTFCPIQNPADKEDDDAKYITHFDYHDIDSNVLKLDILGHGAPSMIRHLYDFTHINPMEVDFSCKEVLSLFKSTKALNIEPSDINGVTLGLLTIPEFGTSFAMQMVIEAKPETVSDLIRLAGLAHGTDVWKHNVEDIINSNIATLKESICCRDDIMIYLIDKGIDPLKSFEIMERIRKGKQLNKDDEELMRSKNIPEWYITCCNKIKYMFPKAHAAAYVISALRIAYFKIFFPVEYYASYFSINIENFDYDMLCVEKNILFDKIKKYHNNENDGKDAKRIEKIFNLMSATQEMFARNIEFMPIDLYKAKAESFVIIDNKIMPPFRAIQGLGETIAKDIEKEAKIKKFENIEDLQERTHINNTLLNKMSQMGILSGLANREIEKQMSIFDIV
ncbi:MAG: PolC-type DNA polymerase III [Eubacteriales bacterium]|nr:PolC-type DNA polymerase III [Eubacteriales bacterium]